MPRGGKRFEEAVVAMQPLGTENEQPGLSRTACLADTKLSYSSHKIFLIGLS